MKERPRAGTDFVPKPYNRWYVHVGPYLLLRWGRGGQRINEPGSIEEDIG